MIPLLPKWCLTNKLPAFYDMESATAIEQTAKLYGAMQGMIDDYNKFVDEFNKTFEDYVNGLNQDHECFQASITKLVHDYIAMLDEKLKMQDKEIEDTVLYIKDNLSTSIQELMVQMKESGEFDEAVVSALDSITSRLDSITSRLDSITSRLDNLETYSTTPTIVGKWINNKPLYRIVVNTPLPETTVAGTNVTSIVEIDTNVEFGRVVSAWLTDDVGDHYVMPNISVKTQGTLVTKASINASGNLKIDNANSGFNTCTVSAIIEYTKTTDSAV